MIAAPVRTYTIGLGPFPVLNMSVFGHGFHKKGDQPWPVSGLFIEKLFGRQEPKMTKIPPKYPFLKT